MEPQGSSQQSGNAPQRKIVFNAPGKQFATTAPQPEPNASAQEPKLPQINMPAEASVYNAVSVVKHKKGGIINEEEKKPEQSVPLPGQPKVDPYITQPGQSANPAFRSFAHDIKSNVADQGVSMAQIVMEEERKRQAAGATAADYEEASHKHRILRIILTIIGSLAILGGGAALFIMFYASAPVDSVITPEDMSSIRAQKVVSLELRDGYKNTLLEAIRGVGATRIPEETFVELKLHETVGTSSEPVYFGRMMEITDARIPDALLRSASDDYVLGMYGGISVNVPFLMFTVDAFENGYVGMREWERTLIADIGGIFIDQDDLSVIIASTAPSLFQDKVYYNKDARVVFGENGEPLLVWAIVDRTRIIVTRDGTTLNALMNRLTLENITR